MTMLAPWNACARLIAFAVDTGFMKEHGFVGQQTGMGYGHNISGSRQPCPAVS